MNPVKCPYCGKVSKKGYGMCCYCGFPDVKGQIAEDVHYEDDNVSLTDYVNEMFDGNWQMYEDNMPND